MHSDAQLVSQVIDEALRTWHVWASSGRPVEGYPTECPSCRMSRARNRADTQYDDAEQSRSTEIAQFLDGLISQFEDPYRTALAINARNITTGVNVWVSARLPENRQKRAEVIAEARSMFGRELFRIGLM